MSIRVMTEVWQSSHATGTKRLMLLALADHAADDGWCYPSVPGLAAKCAIGERNAQLILRELEASGELVTELGAGRGHKNLYWVLPPATRERVLAELQERIEKVKSEGEKVKVSALIEKVKSSAEKVQISAQKVKSSVKKAKPSSPEPSVTINEPSLNRESAHVRANDDLPEHARSGESGEEVREGRTAGVAFGAEAPGGAVPARAVPITGTLQFPAGSERTHATGRKNVPGAAGRAGGGGPPPSTPPDPVRAALLVAIGPVLLGKLLSEGPARAAWLTLDAPRVAELHQDALETSGERPWRTLLINQLDIEVAGRGAPRNLHLTRRREDLTREEWLS